jgi:hypothetical protein
MHSTDSRPKRHTPRFLHTRYDDLANDIADLTPEQRKQPVRLLEPYDEPACLGVVSLAVATAQARNGDEEVLLDEGDIYLQS